jgi:hypothetical protein
MTFFGQIILCWAAFGVAAVLMGPPESHLPGFTTAQDFLRFKEDRRLMQCEMSPQFNEDDEWIRDVPTCSFRGYGPAEPGIGL